MTGRGATARPLRCLRDRRRDLVRPITSRNSWREGWRESIKSLCNRLGTLTRSIPVGAIRTRVRFPFSSYPVEFIDLVLDFPAILQAESRPSRQYLAKMYKSKKRRLAQGSRRGRAFNAVFGSPHCLKSGRGYRRRGGGHRRYHCSFHCRSRECAGVTHDGQRIDRRNGRRAYLVRRSCENECLPRRVR